MQRLVFCISCFWVYVDPPNDFLQWKKNVQDIEGEVLCGM